MSDRVAIIGVGFTALQPSTPHLSFKELTFEAAQKTYLDAGIQPSDVDSFVTCAEDLHEGLSIFDEYTPDQLGAVQKPMHTLTQDGLHGIADAFMQIRAGIAELVLVEAHSKASNIETPEWVVDYALDPVYSRPLGFNPHAVAGLEMNIFLHETRISAEHCAQVAAKNRSNALRNPVAAYPLALTPMYVESSPYVAYPLREAEIAQRADGCAVVILANEKKAQSTQSRPVWVRGVGFANDSATLESRDWARTDYVRIAAESAYRQASIQNPREEIGLFEVDDTYAYKELQHLIALGLFSQAADAGRFVERGETKPDGKMPVNVSGGALGMGLPLEASGLYRVVELVLQLRGQAGTRQLPDVRVGLAQSWRGVPTTSGAVVILGLD
ncbi:MAG TPA: acetyl-CoA acetyltransferase [Candidatus Binatia bacterium]|nr:acetyl-CoA acetyltransferase [Candidatus Binatia bacterium]